MSLCYQTSVGTITIDIAEARGLRAMDINGFSGAYSHCFVPIFTILIKRFHEG